MQDKEILNILIGIFKIENPYIINDLANDLEMIENKDNLIPFIKERISYERFKFLSSMEKLTAMINEFKKDNKPKLNEQQEQIAYSYSDKLFSRTTSCFDEVDYLVQIGNDLDSKKVKAVIYQYFNGRDKDIQVLKMIGDKAKLLKYIQTNRKELQDKIIDTVLRLTLLKVYPSITHSKNEAKNTIKMLQKSIEDKKGK